MLFIFTSSEELISFKSQLPILRHLEPYLELLRNKGKCHVRFIVVVPSESVINFIIERKNFENTEILTKFDEGWKFSDTIVGGLSS